MDKVSVVNKNFLGKLLCKHEYRWFVKPSDGKFAIISGEERVLVCPKCGKRKATMLAEYEGNGFK